MTAARSILLAVLALGLLAGCDDPPQQPRGQENLREVKPPSGPEFTGDVCVVVRNRAPFTITGRVLMKTRERATFRLARNETRRLCLSGTTYGNYTVSFVLTNFVTIPLFSCYTTTEQAIEVFAYQRGDSWLYNATCR
ncbi:hypothetical protein GCM10017083_32860 [Thalassobaculum fulvum]|uniref:Lipoprotein n=1 Tax=Thalassobaculum fulvum TaxID=1633335 RepID=A0A919CQE2_9PROT|nr:hypothetical protein [Thalassobaculum fulvum]GHD54771.1 hypothetical protein GCM10017083_32860 [Thalassobaculum fulvum]